MEIFATIIGLVLTAAGLLLAYFAHPSVVERTNRNKKSILFKFQNFLFGKASSIQPGLSMTLYDIIYDDVRFKEFYEIIKRRYHNLDFIKDDLHSEMNIEFIFLENFLDDCSELKFNPFDVIASIIVEFAWHRRLYLTMKRGVEFELATADGFFVKLCSIELKSRNTQFELRSL